MRYILMVLLAVFGPFCFGHLPKTKEAHIRIMKFLCDSGEKESLCEPVQRLMEAEKQYDLALASEEWKELNEELQNNYTSKADPFLRDLCNVGTPPTSTYMATVCEVLSVLINEAEQNLSDENNRRVIGSDAYKIQQRMIQRVKHEVSEAQKNYEIMREIAMEILCYRTGVPVFFCNVLEKLRTYEEENIYKAEAELRDARIALKSQVDVMCKIEKGKKRSRLHRVYLKALCGGVGVHLHPHFPSSLLLHGS